MLYNRAFAFSYLTQELEKVKRRELKNLCVAYIDLDNFKLVNDLLGHSVGDSVLSEIGELLKQHFRRGDVVARIGGDEFIIIFTNCDPIRIKRRLEFLRSKIENKFKKFGLSMSFGIAEAPKDALLPSFLIRIADERMYKNKKSRKMERGRSRRIEVEETSSEVS
jgi:diguanylate cyclase (GGDEF)-like protein